MVSRKSGRQRSEGTRTRASALILAAGSSKRFGKPKQLVDFGGKGLLQMVIDSARSSKATEVILVLGYRWRTILRSINASGVRVVVNGEWSRGMSSSLQVGIGCVSPRSGGCLVLMGDQPLVTAGLLYSLIRAWRSGEGVAVVPVSNGTQVTPVLLDRVLFDQVSGLTGDVGAKSVLQANSAGVLGIPLDNAAEGEDIDTPTDYDHLLGLKSAMRAGRTRPPGRRGEDPASR